MESYEPVWRAMREFTARRDAGTRDEIWLLQHLPVYTQGMAGRNAHLPRHDRHIPVAKTDRGGQITYHGPGQVVAYLLLDLQRRKLGVRQVVRIMEHAVIALLSELGLVAAARADAPGVYVADAKIASLGLRVSRGCCYHGVALNVDMDLAPFLDIDPCGYPGLAVTQLRDLGVSRTVDQIAELLAGQLSRQIEHPFEHPS